MRAFALLMAVAALVLLVGAPSPAQIKIDGLFFDWPAGAQLDVAPNEEKTFDQGDDTDPVRNVENPSWTPPPSYFADMDIQDVFATDDADWVYFRVKMADIANVLNIATDTSYHGGGAVAFYISVDPGPNDTTGLTWGWWGSGYDYLIQVFPEDTFWTNNTVYQQGLSEHVQGASHDWNFVAYDADSTRGVLVAWNSTSNDVEVAVAKAMLFRPHYLTDFAWPDSIAVMAYAGENNGPWRADYASLAGVKGFTVPIKKPGAMAIDGLFFDWDPAMQLDVAPNEELTFDQGDDTDPVRNVENPSWTPPASYFADMDIQDVYGTDDADYVYLRVKMADIANVANIATDTSYHGGGAVALYISVDPGVLDTTGLTWGWWGSGYDFFVGAYPEDPDMPAQSVFPQPVWEHIQGAAHDWQFEWASPVYGAWVAWNSTGNDVEIAIPKAILLNPRYLPAFTQPDSIAVMAYAGENNGPWRADYASLLGVKGYTLKLGATTDIRPVGDVLPASYSLKQNYPNPFNPATTIEYALPASGQVTLTVFNLLGQEVAVLANGVQSAGVHAVRFDARELNSGVYFYRLEGSGFRNTRKMLLLK